MRSAGAALCGLLACLLSSAGFADAVGEGLAAWRARDYAQARSHWEAAAEAGDAQAMFLLSELYAHGDGVPADDVRALSWLNAAARAGDAPACYNLGDRYLNGRGVDRDPAQAAHWWRRAAVQGLAQAQYNLGSLYYHGLGVSRDLEQAAWWYRQAAAQGSARARQALELLENRGLTPPAAPTEPVTVAAPSPGEADDKLAATLALDADWLRRQPPGHYTVQIFASHDRAAVRRFLADHRFARQVAVYRFVKDGETWHGVVYGRFARRADARAAVDELPADARRGGPWVRQLKDVVALIDHHRG